MSVPLFSRALYRVEAPHFVAGLEVEDFVVTRAAPIVKYMRGWSLAKTLNYCQSKSWTLQQVFR